MNQTNDIGIGAAFIGGLLSFVSPCVFPLIPVYVSLITGISVEALKGDGKTAFWPALGRTALFIAGFSLVFTALGAGAGTVGHVLRAFNGVFRIGGGLLVILFGLHFTGLLPVRMLYREKRMKLATGKLGAFGTILMGMTFALGWTPCIGPWLASILTIAANEGQAGRGAVLLLAYSAGLGLPFLLAAAAFSSFLGVSSRLKKFMHWLELASGFLLIILGILLITNNFSVLFQWSAALFPPADAANAAVGLPPVKPR